MVKASTPSNVNVKGAMPPKFFQGPRGFGLCGMNAINNAKQNEVRMLIVNTNCFD